MYTKATESTNYTNPYFSQQYTGAYNAGLVHGAYHFATPNTSSGAAQADYFVAHGGGWSRDGKTFPGMLDMEWNPYGAACYGLSASGMVNWILSFSNEYHARTSRWPVIYTATSWWSQCTGNTGDFSSTNPLMLANYNGSPGPMPYNWGFQTIWQYADSGVFPGDQDYFNGDYSPRPGAGERLSRRPDLTSRRAWSSRTRPAGGVSRPPRREPRVPRWAAPRRPPRRKRGSAPASGRRPRAHMMNTPDNSMTRRTALLAGAGAAVADARPGRHRARRRTRLAPARGPDAGAAGRAAGRSTPTRARPCRRPCSNQIAAGQAAGVIFFGDNISSLSQIKSVCQQLNGRRTRAARSPRRCC